LLKGIIAYLVNLLFFNLFFFQTYISGSSSNSETIGYPFGYLKAATNLQSVNLFVLPYNYPVLLPLLGWCICV